MSPGWDMEGEDAQGQPFGGQEHVQSTSGAQAEGKGDLLRASHQSFLEGEVGRETREAVSPHPNQETGRWSLESAIMFQNLILTMISGDDVHHLLCT